MIGAPNSLNLNCKVRVMKEAPGPSVSEEIADIFINYNIDCNGVKIIPNDSDNVLSSPLMFKAPNILSKQSNTAQTTFN